MVPGSTLMYGSHFISVTLRPCASNRAPIDAAVIPLPREETTPPVTKTYFVAINNHLSRKGRAQRVEGRGSDTPLLGLSSRLFPLSSPLFPLCCRVAQQRHQGGLRGRDVLGRVHGNGIGSSGQHL